MKAQKLKKIRLSIFSILPFFLLSVSFVLAVSLSNYSQQSLNVCNPNTRICQNESLRLTNGCGAGSGWVGTSIDFGCQGNSCPAQSPHTSNQPPGGYCSSNHNGIIDLVFAIIRFLSDGVGLVVIASVVIGGIQYIVSRGDPNATQTAIKRLTSSLIAFVVFIFAYAILNYVIPGTFFK